MNTTPDPRTLLVGLADPDALPQLMSLALRLHRLSGCEIVATHIATIAAQMHLGSAQVSPEVAHGRELCERAVALAESEGVAINGLIEIGREVGEGLASAVDSRGADLVLLGYSQAPESGGDGGAQFDRLMHRVARSVDVDLVVARFRQAEVGSILVPIKRDPALRVRGLLLRAILAGTQTPVSFLHVVAPDEDEAEHREAVEGALAARGLRDLGDLVVVRADEIEATVIAACNEHDLALVGAEPRPAITKGVLGSRAERIAQEARASVLLIREMNEG